MNWKILYKYIEGTCSEEELRQLGLWLRENSANEDFFKTFIEQVDRQEYDDFEADAQFAWEKFRSRIGNRSQSDTSADNPFPSGIVGKRYPVMNKTRRIGWWRWYYTAAAVMLITVLVYWSKQVIITPKNTPELAARTIVTEKGQRTTLELGDGTRVIMNAESELKIPSDYGVKSRTIYLKGEAFFEVTHDKENPFMVVTNHTYVRDLGTKFNVKAYDTSRTEVAVSEGLVSFGKMDKGKPQTRLAEISPNKLGILKNSGTLTVSNISDINDYTGWTKGKLVFKKTSFPEVVKKLERWYDVDCQIDDPNLNQRTLTATYDQMSLGEVLRVLSLSMHVSYSRHNRTIIFENEKHN